MVASHIAAAPTAIAHSHRGGSSRLRATAALANAVGIRSATKKSTDDSIR
jgi:hypothetical protein